MYFDGCSGASAGAEVEGSGVGESEEIVDDEGESSRERLGIACANIAVRRLLWLQVAQHTIPRNATSFPQMRFREVFDCTQLESGNYEVRRVPADSAAHGVTKLYLGLGLIGHKGWI